MNNIEESLKNKINLKTKPVGSLGKLEEIALKAGKIQNTRNPELNNPTILVFAGDHGLTDEGVSPFPKEVTFQMVMNFIGGGAAINVFCNQNDINLKVVDAGVDYDFDKNLNIVHSKIAYGTKNMMNEPAMNAEICSKALDKGRELVKAEAKAGCNIIGFGEMGIGNTSSASLLMSHFTGVSIDEATGRGTGHDDEGLKEKKDILNKVLNKYTPNSPEEALAIFGGLEIAMMSGAFIEAATQGMIVMVDGFISSAAFLTAYEMDNSILKNAIFCHSSKEPGHLKMMNYLKVEPLVDLNMRLGEGSGAAVAFPLIKSAVNFLNQMASFEDAGVSNKE